MSGSIVHFLDALTYKGYVKVAGGQVVLLPFHSSVRLRFWKCLYGAAASLPPYFWSRGHVLIQPLITVAIWSGIWELHNIIWFALKVHMHVSQFPPPQIRTTHTHTHTHTVSGYVVLLLSINMKMTFQNKETGNVAGWFERETRA